MINCKTCYNKFYLPTNYRLMFWSVDFGYLVGSFLLLHNNSSYFEFQYNNQKNKVRIFEYLGIRLGAGGGVIVPGGCPGTVIRMFSRVFSTSNFMQLNEHFGKTTLLMMQPYIHNSMLSLFLSKEIHYFWFAMTSLNT